MKLATRTTCVGRSARASRTRTVACSAGLKPQNVTSGLAAAAASSILLLGSAGPALAYKEKVGEFAASGLIFKDSVEVEKFADPEIDGVTLYFADFKRSITDKLAKDFFTEPSQASITCAITGPIKIKDMRNIEGSEGREVFSEKKGLNFFTDKTLRVRRLYDKESNVVVYVSYSTRLSGASAEGQVSTGRYRTSICALPLTLYAAQAPSVTAASPAAATLAVDAPAP